MLLLAVGPAATVRGATITVTNTNDSGAGSLLGTIRDQVGVRRAYEAPGCRCM